MLIVVDLCIGYNSLPHIAKGPEETIENDGKEAKNDYVDPDHDSNPTRHPMGKRVWNWLVLCDDGKVGPSDVLDPSFTLRPGTVVSISEDPFPSSRNHWTQEQKMAFKIIRRNLLTVVRQLSNVKNDWRKANPILTLDIRPGMQSNLNSKVTLLDSPGLLFYYLFDDWYTSYALVAKKEQQYAARLETLVICDHQPPSAWLTLASETTCLGDPTLS